MVYPSWLSMYPHCIQIVWDNVAEECCVSRCHGVLTSDLTRIVDEAISARKEYKAHILEVIACIFGKDPKRVRCCAGSPSRRDLCGCVIYWIFQRQVRVLHYQATSHWLVFNVLKI